MTTLLDANVLVALLVDDHIHHRSAERWLATNSSGFATCPMTQGSLVRLLLRQGQTAATARELVGAVARDSRHEFWPDSLSFTEVIFTGVIGHRQVADAYLAQLARSHSGRLATFDQGLAQLHSDVADLLPTD
ncbi:TA system VapC family ribonuclease toxin [[Mycobacterium] nativiensis]|uniref:Ribonuclease VapC n=1 Tax=[Mycobacterium] nativiensis TaxID=2855503 RepID=A0ABU5XS07_9MYCO|nr:TA system VapC family ribonuclease toxin [Mycolicibacter sp. MYC340]MEB3030754.1 TA system VapC family ribonuclease toxin [Mycolicibacter sp. MYC340]